MKLGTIIFGCLTKNCSVRINLLRTVLRRAIVSEPRVSIVTIVKDDPEGLLATCRSLALLTGRTEVEVIVWINAPGEQERPYLNELETLVDTIVVGQDCGIFDAMNRALEFVSSDLCLFLNARDTVIAPFNVQEISGPCLIQVQYIDYFGRKRQVRPNPTIKFGIPYCHQGMILPTNRCRFDSSLRFGGDYLFLIESGIKWPLPMLESGLINYDTEGVSTRNRWASDKWTAMVIWRKFGSAYSIAYLVKSLGKLAIKRIFDLWVVLRVTMGGWQ